MTNEKLISLEGKVANLVYCNSREPDASGLPENFVSLKIRTRNGRVNVLLTGKYIPPIQNETYVEVILEKVRLKHRETDDYVVRFMWGKESESGKEFWEYQG
ncbi:MAG: hypothetical protein AABW71_01130 [Nanoarchaeota archaeon]